jgi:hypothetical protein
MIKRLYFTDLTKALYMMKEFGVIFIVGDQGYYNYENCLPYTLEHLTNRAKYYVASESEYLFEEKKGDIGIRADNDRLAIAEATSFETFEEPNFAYSSRRYWKVIMRDNKLFFQPETE